MCENNTVQETTYGSSAHDAKENIHICPFCLSPVRINQLAFAVHTNQSVSQTGYSR